MNFRKVLGRSCCSVRTPEINFPKVWTGNSRKTGQKSQELDGNRLTYFFKNGKVKAEGLFVNNKMEGEWKFYPETGQLWQVGNFKNNRKNGPWIRYDKRDQLEYHENFVDDKLIKK